MLSQLRLTLRPNNQVTIGLQNCVGAKPDIYKSLACIEGGLGREERYRIKRAIAATKKTNEPKYDWAGRLIVRQVRRKLIYCPPPKLDLIQKFQRTLECLGSAAFRYLYIKSIARALSHFGQFRLNPERQFSAVAGQRIREAGAAMELASNGQMRFCHCTTLTLPANNRAAFECLAAYSSYAVNRLFQVLRRLYPDMNYWFFCWEFQKRGALHLHIAHYHPDESEGLLIGNILIEQWHKILCDISENSGVYMLGGCNSSDYELKPWYQYHTQPIQKSVAGYFAKYAGKASKSEENSYVRLHAKTLSPKRYWGSSFQLKKIIKENSYASLFDVGNGMEAEKRYQSMLSIILQYKILSANRYEFRKEIEWNEYYGFKGNSNRRKLKRVVAEGFRETFYVSPSDYQEILSIIREEDEFF